jgi:hypothetical protein
VPTFFRESSGYSKLLDLIGASPCAASKLKNFKCEVNELLVSDHLPIEVWFSLKLARNNSNSTDKEQKWDFKKANWDLFCAELDSKLNELLSLINKPHDVEMVNKFLKQSILDAAVISIPKIINRNNHSALPASILELIKKRHEARKKLKNSYFSLFTNSLHSFE